MTLTPPPYLRYALTTLALATAVLLGLPYGLHLFTNDAGGFGVDKLNAFALAAALFWLVLQLGFVAYRYLFPRFKTYQSECLEGEGKLFEPLTEILDANLDQFKGRDFQDERLVLAYVQERRKTQQFKFLIRCVRLAFCLLVLFGLIWLAQWAVTVGMGLLPGGLK